jgi:hypothetical protein
MRSSAADRELDVDRDERDRGGRAPLSRRLSP